MTQEYDHLLALAKNYLTAIEQGATGERLAAFFTPDVIQEEFPNRLVPTGARRDLAQILDGALKGQYVLSAQSYHILEAFAAGDHVALEVQWTGTLAIPIGKLAIGDQMRARFAVFLTYRDGKIVSQRNYDCFEPWDH